MNRLPLVAAAVLGLTCLSLPALADDPIFGHGPDSWRVDGVAAGDQLNGRMGPGTGYPVTARFAHDERGLEMITCVPFLLPGAWFTMTEAERDALPPRWCLMRSADLERAGWANARFLVEDSSSRDAAAAPDAGPAVEIGDPMIDEAVDVVRALYEVRWMQEEGAEVDLFDPAVARNFFFADIARNMRSYDAGADLLYGTQDYDISSCEEPVPDPDRPVFRGAATLHVDCINFGRRQRATFHLRADPDQPGTPAPLRIFRIDHEGWSFP
jgi:hypothetical protein